MTFLFFGANYHLEHHAYPGVPCYRLPRLHRYLASLGTYDRVNASHDARFFGVFQSIALPYAVSADAEDFDPFVRAPDTSENTERGALASSVGTT
jgi:fatty acid desaturase